ncbi:hypothetical protein OAL86_05165 [Verrucomicrobia bacterium]|nr:hypothetical protein [Verrucomicrobiota bacterium]
MIGLKQNKPVSVLSLDWRYDTLRFESVRKSTNACQSREKGELNLPEDLFSVEPELVGTQLREKLKVRERNRILLGQPLENFSLRFIGALRPVAFLLHKPFGVRSGELPGLNHLI